MQVPQAAIPIDTIHLIRHLSDSLDAVRKAECARHPDAG